LPNDRDDRADLLPDAPLSQAAALVRRLLWIYTAFAGVLLLLLAPGVLPGRRLPGLRAAAAELAHAGLGAGALTPVFLTLTVLAATGALAFARLSVRRAEVTSSPAEAAAVPAGRIAERLDRLLRRGVGFAGREAQAAILSGGALVVALAAWLLWPMGDRPLPPGTNANLIAAIVIGMAFPSLIAERMVNAFPPEQLPEAPGLRRLLLLTTIFLAASGVTEIGRGLGFGWAYLLQRLYVIVVLLMTAEFALRGLARLFLPEPGADAKAVSESLLAGFVTGGAGTPAVLIRTHLGLDFERSWALSFLSAAALPALVCTLLFCWALSGVKLLDANQRGIYERLGAPVAVLGPGFHLLAPWPLGRLRPVENGTIHIVAVGAKGGPNAYEKDSGVAQVGVEGVPTASMNRLWTTAHGTEAEYLVADVADGKQTFQAVNGEILVLYRTGLTNADAMESVYGAANPSQVVEQEADRLATRYFSSNTLDGVMGGQREMLQESLRAQLERAVAADHIGIEIVAVLIDAIHPPVGAAAAYHAVQAAQINAEASAATATAHATRAAGQSEQEAHQAIASAQAGSVEKIQAAVADAYTFGDDRKGYRTSPPAFLQERRARNLIKALNGAHVTVIDHHLSGEQMPFLDMRQGQGSSQSTTTSEGASGEASAPPLTPGTSSERDLPPLTSEEADERASGSERY
jgi:regulator of protease activity HflC (stomatin/prohibitin superfamily)